MRSFVVITSFFIPISLSAQTLSPEQDLAKVRMSSQEHLIGKVYTLDNAKLFNSKTSSFKVVFDGSNDVLTNHYMTLITLHKGGMMTYADSKVMEHFFIIKKGSVKVSLKGKTTSLNRGSVVLLLPTDMIKFENDGSDDIEYYEMTYIAHPADLERGTREGGSFTMDWKDMAFKPSDKGGVRQLFDRRTAMFNRFDIHVTQLNEGNKSHDPHQHKNEEIILMLEGNAEMQIGTDHQKANPGDVVFLSSNILHNLTNIGKSACLYFAIQWN
ncbi:MAG: cupin [Sediminibacterium sp.]|nr:cupin [Sediminibacterium sp.]